MSESGKLDDCGKHREKWPPKAATKRNGRREK